LRENKSEPSERGGHPPKAHNNDNSRGAGFHLNHSRGVTR